MLDVGCGFGASSLELAALRPSQVVGLDMDRPVLGVAAEVAATGRVPGPAMAAGSTVGFAAGDAYRLPFPDRSFNGVSPGSCSSTWPTRPGRPPRFFRVLRPGGLACVVDVDDGLSISEPPPSEAFERLAGALRAGQVAAGGDRRIGRRLAGILDGQGLQPGPVLVLPQAAYHRPKPGDPERGLMLERLRTARESIVGGGHMTAGQFDADLAALVAEEPGPTCEIEAHLAVVASRPI